MIPTPTYWRMKHEWHDGRSQGSSERGGRCAYGLNCPFGFADFMLIARGDSPLESGCGKSHIILGRRIARGGRDWCRRRTLRSFKASLVVGSRIRRVVALGQAGNERCRVCRRRQGGVSAQRGGKRQPRRRAWLWGQLGARGDAGTKVSSVPLPSRDLTSGRSPTLERHRPHTSRAVTGASAC
jgi:hypothetical protein